LAIGGVLESQINRALSGLEASEQVTTEEWAGFRNMCDTYFTYYRELTSLIWADYLSKLIREFPAKRIQEAFEPELQPLNDLAQQMTGFRQRVESLRTAKCFIMTSGRRGIPFGYFQSVFSEQRWLKIADEMNSMQTQITNVVTPGAAIAPAHAAG
jgi:hypothetical protein